MKDPVIKGILIGGCLAISAAMILNGYFDFTYIQNLLFMITGALIYKKMSVKDQ